MCRLCLISYLYEVVDDTPVLLALMHEDQSGNEHVNVNVKQNMFKSFIIYLRKAVVGSV